MKPKTKTILFVLLSFLLGIVCGWFIQDRLFRWGGPGAPPDFHKFLTERLHLDEHQIAQVDSLLEVRRQQMDMHRKQIFAMRDTMRMEIRKVLNTDQVKLFDAILQEKDARDAKIYERDSKKK
jgi:hypothetical protein